MAARTYALRNRGQFAGQGLRHLRDARPARSTAAGPPSTRSPTRRSRRPAGSSRCLPRHASSTRSTPRPAAATPRTARTSSRARRTPYLRGVACAPERVGLGHHPHARPRRGARRASRGLNRDAALLIALDVLDPRRTPRPRCRAPPTDEELRGWTSRLLAAARAARAARPRRDGALTRRGAFFRHLVARLCWDERGSACSPPRTRTTCCRSRTAPSSAARASAWPPRCSCRRACSPLPGQHAAARRAHHARRRRSAILARAALRRPARRAWSPREFRAAAAAGLAVAARARSRETYPARPRRAALPRARRQPAGRLRADPGRGREGPLRAARGPRGVPGGRAEPAGGRRRPRLALLPLGGAPDARTRSRRAVARYGTVGAVRDVVPRRLGRLRPRGRAGGARQRRRAGAERPARCAGAWACARTSSWSTASSTPRATWRASSSPARAGATASGCARWAPPAWRRRARRYEQILKHYYTGHARSAARADRRALTASRPRP